jgi:hypothetical protein
MSALTNWLLTTTLLLAPMPAAGPARYIEVDCSDAGALERALAKAGKWGEIDITLHGVCEGNFVIAGGNVTLRGATVESGLAAPADDPGQMPVLEVAGGLVSLRGMIVRGGVVGVQVHGSEAELFLFEADVHDQLQVGVAVSDGARGRLWDSTIHDGQIGIVVDSLGEINLQGVTVSHQREGVIVWDRSSAVLSDTTIENCAVGGLNVDDRSDAIVYGGAFRENGQVHIGAVDQSSVSLAYETTIGSEMDATSYALTATRGSRISSYNAPFIFGDVGVLDNGSIRLGDTVLDGNLIVRLFSDVHVRNSEITGIVFCDDGGEAICSQTTSGGVIDCPSPTCGSAPVGAVSSQPSVPEFSVVEMPRLEWTPPTTSDRHR